MAKKLEDQLFDECKHRGYSCSITYQRINDFSVEIYKGHELSYQSIFFSDGHLDSKRSIRKALRFLKKSV